MIDKIQNTKIPVILKERSFVVSTRSLIITQVKVKDLFRQYSYHILFYFELKIKYSCRLLYSQIAITKSRYKYFYMKTACILIFLTLLLLSKAGKLPIQAHSFNDFNYLQNLINKGIDYFKLDVSMANRQSCQQFSTWNRSKKCYKSSQYVQEICCLAFRGDASSRPNFQFQFNTTDEYLNFMNKNLAQIVTYQPKRKLLFAINFQYSHSFNDTITEQFLVGLASLMETYPNNLLLGTGSDDFILQYDRICYGKGAPQCNDIRRKISKSNLFLQSGSSTPFDPRDYYKRYRNFNIYYKGIQSHCQNGFPEWITKYPEFPLIFWQPSNQKQIQYVLEKFLSPSCMKRHGRNISGMAIATNIDPEMFDIYMKKMVEPASVHLNLQVDAAPVPTFSYPTEKLFITERQSIRLAKQTQGQTQVIFSASVNVYLRNKLTLQRWQTDSKNKIIKLAASRQFSSLVNETEILDSLMTDGVGHIILITSDSVSPGSKIYYFHNITFELISYKKWDKIYGSFMRKDQLIYVTCDYPNLFNCSIIGAIQFKQTKVYANFFANLFFSSITSLQEYDGGFIAAGNSMAVSDLAVALIIRDGRVVAPEIPLALGKNPKIFRKQLGKQYGVLIQNGMCHSALLINNNDMNKCNFFKQPQFSSLRSVRGLISFVEFNLEDLIRNKQPISPCNPKLSLTKLMNGGNADILELPGLGSYLIASEYLRIEDQDLMSSLFCGGSNFDKQFQYREKSSMLTTMLLSNVDSVSHAEELKKQKLIKFVQK